MSRRASALGLALVLLDACGASRPNFVTTLVTEDPTPPPPTSNPNVAPVASQPSAHAFGQSAKVNTGTGPATSPALTVDNEGVPVLAWLDATSGPAQVYVATFGGAQWGGLNGSATGTGVSGLANGAATSPAVAVDLNDTVVVSWLQNTGGQAGLMLKRHLAAGWSGMANKSALHLADSGKSPGIFAVDDITWSAEGNGFITTGNGLVGPPSKSTTVSITAKVGGYTVMVDGVDQSIGGQQVYIVGYNSTDTGIDNPGLWGMDGLNPPNEASFTLPADNAGTRYSHPQILGKFQLGKEDLFAGAIRNAAVVLYYAISFNTANNADIWVAAPTLGSGVLSFAYDVDNAARMYVAFEQVVGSNHEIMMAVLEPGSKQWTGMAGDPTPDNVSNDNGDSLRPSIIIDESGKPNIAWEDNTSGTSAIYLKRWDGTAWSPVGASASGSGVSGMPNVSATQAQVQSDLSSHAIVAWQANNSVYAVSWY